MKKQERLELINSFKEKYIETPTYDLWLWKYMDGHDYGSSDDDLKNHYDGIQYDCACWELYKRGVYKPSIEDKGCELRLRLDGNYDYRNHEFDKYNRKEDL